MAFLNAGLVGIGACLGLCAGASFLDAVGRVRRSVHGTRGSSETKASIWDAVGHEAVGRVGGAGWRLTYRKIIDFDVWRPFWRGHIIDV